MKDNESIIISMETEHMNLESNNMALEKEMDRLKAFDFVNKPKLDAVEKRHRSNQRRMEEIVRRIGLLED